VTLSVADTGPGVPAELEPLLFSPFFTTRPQAGGTGLGLWVSRALVEQHGGALEFESPVHAEHAPGSCPGTRFRFTLPAA
jgi:two-component system sensor histidine kinase DctS